VAIIVNHWQRRDGTGIEAFGNAAYELCRAERGVEGIASSKFYWVNSDTIVIQSEAESFEVFDRAGTPEQGKAIFALSDIARPASTERWQGPRGATELYRRAGR
jgi:hypothetical protein